MMLKKKHNKSHKKTESDGSRSSLVESDFSRNLSSSVSDVHHSLEGLSKLQFGTNTLNNKIFIIIN